MRIVVLNGSPKGILSATLHYVFYLQKKFPEHEFTILHICQEHDSLERDPAALERILDVVRQSDAVLWSFPIYTFLVHAYYKRFIELVNARGAQSAFAGKYAASVSTSIHFFDHTAINYLHATCDDWDAKFVGAFSAFVYDLVEKKEQQRLVAFAKTFFAAVERQIPVPKIHDPVEHSSFPYAPSPAKRRAALGAKKMVILTDSLDEDGNLARMVRRFRESIDGEPEVVNLQTCVRFGCDGCFQCGADGQCIFRNADGVNDLYLLKLESADIIVMAGTIVDRYLSWKWKIFFDRGFFKPIIPWWPGKQLGFLVSGPLKQLPNLRQILEGYVEFHQGSLVGIVTDESGDSTAIDGLLEDLAERLVFCAEQGYVKPQTFLGIGGTKIFRDGAWGFLRPVFQVAHYYYRDHGMYDFPQKNFQNWLLITFGMFFTRLPGVRKRFFQTVKKGMLRPLERVLKKVK